MPDVTHRIRKQKFSVLHNGNTNVFSLQQATEQFCKERFLPALEKLFDKEEDGSTVYLPKLNLQFSIDTITGFNELLVQEMVEKVFDEMQVAKRLIKDSGKASSPNDTMASYIFFLQNGFLKNIHGGLNTRLWTQNVMTALDNSSVKQKKYLHDILQGSNAIRHLASLQSEELFWHTISCLVKGQAVLKDMETLYYEWKQMMQKLSISFPAIKVKSFFASSLIRDEAKINFAIIIQMKKLLVLEIMIPTKPIKAKVESQQAIILKMMEGKQVENGKLEVEDLKEQKQNPEVNEIFVPNAGLVLVHPFLNKLFNQVGLIEQGELIDKSRAIALLHFIATGTQKSEPFELVLPKIFMGVPLDDKIEVDYMISENEKEEVENLLQAVITHWNVLKNTSIEGLRQTFLQRPGILNMEDDKISLVIEPASFDMLLDQLPWTISMIKLPWMEELLTVDWLRS